jgi:hypothetical protein
MTTGLRIAGVHRAGKPIVAVMRRVHLFADAAIVGAGIIIASIAS